MKNEKLFGGSGITHELFKYITSNSPLGKTILELGAGEVSTRYLSEKYVLFSVEDNHKFIGAYKSTYIYAPIDLSTNWYSLKSLAGIPQNYDCILVDGPAGEGNRQGFVTNVNLFRDDCPIIIDDTWREGERSLIISLGEKTGRQFTLFESFGILHSRVSK